MAVSLWLLRRNLVEVRLLTDHANANGIAASYWLLGLRSEQPVAG